MVVTMMNHETRHDDPNDPDNPINCPPEYLAYCATHAAADPDPTVEDYPGQHVGIDVEACPGCGCMPGDGITEDCSHPDGCGYWRAEAGQL